MTTTSIRLGELVNRFGGQLIGSPDLTVIGIAPLDEANVSQLTFLSNSKLRAQAQATQASALILTDADHALISADAYQGARIITPKPYVYFARVAQYFFERNAPAREVGIHPSAWVSPNAIVDPSAYIGPNATVGAQAIIAAGVTIGAGCVIGGGAEIAAQSLLHANVTVYAFCIIGERCVIQSGAVIGADGFGYANDAGNWIKIPQTGRVLIGNDVEIGANTCIDRGALADTIIEDGVILDNQIQIGHNCHIGAHTAMAGCVGVAGSAKIGKYCTFGGAAMVLGHLTIVDNVHVSSASMVSRSILEPGQYTGFYPLAKNADWEKSASIVRNLGGMRDKLKQLEKSIKLLSTSHDQEQDDAQPSGKKDL